MGDKLRFQPFDEGGQVRVYYNGFLPHWRQSGCTYFVTFRLADSVPQAVLDEWRCENDKWLSARGVSLDAEARIEGSRNLSSGDRRLLQRWVTRRLFKYLDRGCGECQLRVPQVARIVADAMVYFHGERLETGDFVVTPNHIHALLTPLTGRELEKTLCSIKSFTSNVINRAIGRSGALWMDETHDHIVRDGEELGRIQEYIHNNPDKAGLTPGMFILHQAEYDK